MILLTAMLLVAHRRHAYTSDDTGLQTILHTWPGSGGPVILGEDTFLLKAPGYVIVGHVFGESRQALFLSTWAFNTAGVAAFCIGAWQLLGRFATTGRVRTLAVAGAIWWTTAGGVTATLLLRPNLRNAELGFGILLLALLVSVAERRTRSSVAPIALAIALGFLFLDDPFLFYVLFAPAALLGVVQIRSHDWSRWLAAAVVGGGVVVWRLSVAAVQSAGLDLSRVPITVVDAEVIGAALSQTLHGLLIVANADIFGASLPPHVGEINTFLNAAIVVVAGYGCLSMFRRSGDPWSRVVAVAPLICVLAYAGTSVGSIPSTERYLLPAVLEASLGLGYLIVSSSRAGRTAVVVLLATGGVANVADAVDRARDEPPPSVARLEEARTTLEGVGIRRGYADFWAANSLTYQSSFKLDVLPVHCVEQRTVWRPNYVDMSRFDHEAQTSFYLFDPVARATYPLGNVLVQFGEPVRQVSLTDGREILVYDHDIGAAARPSPDVSASR